MHFDTTLDRAHMLAKPAPDAAFPLNVRHPTRFLIDRHVTTISACDIAKVARNAEFLVDMTPNFLPL